MKKYLLFVIFQLVIVLAAWCLMAESVSGWRDVVYTVLTLFTVIFGYLGYPRNREELWNKCCSFMIYSAMVLLVGMMLAGSEAFVQIEVDVLLVSVLGFLISCLPVKKRGLARHLLYSVIGILLVLYAGWTVGLFVKIDGMLREIYGILAVAASVYFLIGLICFICAIVRK